MLNRCKRPLLGLFAAWFLLTSTFCTFPAPAQAQSVWYYSKLHNIEDPRLQLLVNDLLGLVHTLFHLLWGFGWLQHPRIFYRTLKGLIVVWFHLMSQLYHILMQYIAELETEISKTKCKDQSCTQLGP